MKVKIPSFVVVLLILGCSSNNHVSILVEEFRKEIINGKVKEYSYFESPAIKNENGNYVPYLGTRVNKSRGFAKFPFGRGGSSSGVGYIGLFDTNGLLTKEYLYASGHYPTLLNKYEYEKGKIQRVYRFKMPDSIKPIRIWRGIYMGDRIIKTEEHERQVYNHHPIDTMVVTSLAKRKYNSKNELSIINEKINLFTDLSVSDNNLYKKTTAKSIKIIETRERKNSFSHYLDAEDDRIISETIEVNEKDLEQKIERIFYENGNLKKKIFKNGSYREYNEQGYITYEYQSERNQYIFLYGDPDENENWTTVEILRVINSDTIPFSYGNRKISYY